MTQELQEAALEAARVLRLTMTGPYQDHAWGYSGQGVWNLIHRLEREVAAEANAATQKDGDA